MHLKPYPIKIKSYLLKSDYTHQRKLEEEMTNPKTQFKKVENLNITKSLTQIDNHDR